MSGWPTVDQFAEHLRRDPFKGDDARRATQHLDAATSVVRSRCGLPPADEHVHRVHPSGRTLVLPVWGDGLSVIEIRDPAGVVVAMDAGLSRLSSGVVGVPVARPGAWTVKVAADASPVPEELALATLIIAAHLWETQRGTSARPQAFPGGGEERPSGMGYAIPNRAAELMAPHVVPTVA